MAATLNLYMKAAIILDGNVYDIGDLFAPYTTSTSADIKSIKTVVGTKNTSTEILSVGASAGDDLTSMVAAIVLSTIAGFIVVRGADDADNSAIPIQANFPVLITGPKTTAYGATPALRAAGADSTISKLYFQNESAVTDAKVQVFAVG